MYSGWPGKFKSRIHELESAPRSECKLFQYVLIAYRPGNIFTDELNKTKQWNFRWEIYEFWKECIKYPTPKVNIRILCSPASLFSVFSCRKRTFRRKSPCFPVTWPSLKKRMLQNRNRGDTEKYADRRTSKMSVQPKFARDESICCCATCRFALSALRLTGNSSWWTTF